MKPEFPTKLDFKEIICTFLAVNLVTIQELNTRSKRIKTSAMKIKLGHI